MQVLVRRKPNDNVLDRRPGNLRDANGTADRLGPFGKILLACQPALCRFLRIFAIVLLSLFVASIAKADKFATNEEVEVYYMNSWLPGTVKQIGKKGEILVEFKSHNVQKEQAFPQENVRHLYESGALSRGRIWSDATGSFKTKAALLKISGGKVELKTEELKEISVAIDKLSARDQAFVKQLKEKAGVSALPIATIPSLTEFDTSVAIDVSGNSRRMDYFKDPGTELVKLNLTPDPARKSLKAKQGGAGFPTENSREGIRSVIALGGADNWILASIEPEDNPTQLIWSSISKGEVRKIQLLPAGESMMDYHTSSKQLLTYRLGSKSDHESRDRSLFTVWQTDPSTEEPKAVVAWIAKNPGDSNHGSNWARFVSGTKVIHRQERGVVLAWDFVEKQLAWKGKQDSFFQAEPLLSYSGKYLYLPEENGMRILDASSGKELANVPMSDCGGIGIHPDGKRVAMCSRNRIYVLDITGEVPTRLINADTISGTHQRLDWIGDSFLCIEQHQGFVLFSLDLALPIWSYSVDEQAYAYGKEGRKRSIVDDHLIYAARIDTFQGGLVVGAVSLPGEKAQSAIASVKREDYFALKKGDSVRIEIDAIDHATEIRQAIEKKVVANGWILDPGSQNVLKAEYKRSPPEQKQYEMRRDNGGQSQIQSVTTTPYLAKIALLIDKQEAWGTIQVSYPPSSVRMMEVTELQNEVDKMTRPNWEYYEKLEMPSEIIDPKKRGGLGKSFADKRGLVERP